MKDKIKYYLIMISLALLTLFMVGIICLDLWAYIHYANTPITEVPAWAFFILGGK